MEKKLAALLRSKEEPQPQIETQTATKVEEPILVEQIDAGISSIPKLEKLIADVEEKVKASKENLVTKIEYVDVKREIDKEENKKQFKDIEKKFERVQKKNDKKISELKEIISKKEEKTQNGDEKTIEILNNILNFLKKNREEDKFQREKEKNFQLELKEEKDRKDQEFLKAITATKVSKLNGKVTEKPKESEDGGFFGFLKDFFSGIMGLFSGLKTLLTTVTSLATTIGKFLIKLPSLLIGAIKTLFGGFSQILKLLPMIARFFLVNPIGIALLAGASLLSLLALDKEPEKTTKAMLGAGSPDAAAASEIAKTTESTTENAIERKKQNLLLGRPKDKKSWNPFKDSDLQKEYLKEIGWDENTGTTQAERNAGVERIDDQGKLVYRKTESLDAKKAEQARSDFAKTDPRLVTPQQTATTQTPSVTPTTSGGVTDSTQLSSATSPPGAISTTKNAPQENVSPRMALPEAVQNIGQKMASLSNENAEIKLFETVGDFLSKTFNNVSTSIKGQTQSPIDKIPSVRNQEETFQRMIFNNTRLV